MLSPGDSYASLVLGIVAGFIGLVLLFVSMQQNTLSYRRFVKFNSSWKRRNLMRKWLTQSLIVFGWLSVIALVFSWQFLAPLHAALDEVNPLNSILSWGLVVVIAAGLLLAPLLRVRVSKKGKVRVPRVVELTALLPKNRQELRLAAGLALNAGVVEEVLFRLALPTLLFGATGHLGVSVVVSVVMYGALHLYKGVLGTVSATLVGVLLMVTFVVSGNILVPIVLHVLIDLRSLVFIPVVFGRVHRRDARW